MKFIIIVAFILCSLNSPAWAADVPFSNGTLQLTIPQSFTPLTEEEILLKFPRNSKPPLVSYADSRRANTIAVTWSELNPKLTPSGLPSFKLFMKKNLERSIPNLKWVDHGLKQINDRHWVYLESRVPGIDVEIHNLMFFTDVKGDMLGINFTAPESNWEQYRLEVDSIIAGLAVK